METFRAGERCLVSPACRIGIPPCRAVKPRPAAIAVPLCGMSPQLPQQSGNAQVHTHKSLPRPPALAGVGAYAASRGMSSANESRSLKSLP